MITFIVGLPGSGKTMLAQAIAEAQRVTSPDRPIRIIDDPRTFEDHAMIIAASHDDGDVLVCDPYLCLARMRNVAAAEFPDAIWIFFANDPQACLANVTRRNDGRLVNTFLAFLSDRYRPPADARPVWRPFDSAS